VPAQALERFTGCRVPEHHLTDRGSAGASKNLRGRGQQRSPRAEGETGERTHQSFDGVNNLAGSDVPDGHTASGRYSQALTVATEAHALNGKPLVIHPGTGQAILMLLACLGGKDFHQHFGASLTS
jgi:hypothetical protein